ncbi:NAD-dependent epimerase/dehydratase family protein [Streptomyces sp. NPDC005151]
MKVRRAVAGEPVTMRYDGTVRRDLLHVDDVARAHSATLDRMDEPAGRHRPRRRVHHDLRTGRRTDPESRTAPDAPHRDLGSVRRLRVRYRGLATVP